MNNNNGNVCYFCSKPATNKSKDPSTIIDDFFGQRNVNDCSTHRKFSWVLDVPIVTLIIGFVFTMWINSKQKRPVLYTYTWTHKMRVERRLYRINLYFYICSTIEFDIRVSSVVFNSACNKNYWLFIINFLLFQSNSFKSFLQRTNWYCWTNC